MTVEKNGFSCCETASDAASDAASATAPDTASNTASIQEQVRAYYGSTLRTSADLATNACCCGTDTQPAEILAVLPLIADEIIARSYGCGSPLPPLLEGATVLDLGCGTGQDCFVAAKLVGEGGRVIGIDMTPEQLEVARRYESEQAERFGFSAPNTTFIQGYIEDLVEAGIEDASVDVVISNCVINLSPHKEQVFREIYRVLKPGGELYFSDVFASRRIPEAAQSDPVIRGECLGGALYVEDFRRLMARVGWPDFRTVASTALTVDEPRIARTLAGIDFSSRTVRAIKSELLEDRCEDYGQTVQYRGSIPHHEDGFTLDSSHVFIPGDPVPACGNSAAMLQESRYAPHFIITSDRSTHYGLFPDCDGSDSGSGSCC